MIGDHEKYKICSKNRVGATART